MRRKNSPMEMLLCEALCGAQDFLDSLSDAIISGEFGLQLLAALRSEAIEADLAIGFRDAPFGDDPALDKHLLEGRVKEGRCCMDRLEDQLL